MPVRTSGTHSALATMPLVKRCCGRCDQRYACLYVVPAACALHKTPQICANKRNGAARAQPPQCFTDLCIPSNAHQCCGAGKTWAALCTTVLPVTVSTCCVARSHLSSGYTANVRWHQCTSLAPNNAGAPECSRLYASDIVLKRTSAFPLCCPWHKSGWCCRHSFLYAVLTCAPGAFAAVRLGSATLKVRSMRNDNQAWWSTSGLL